MGVRYTWSLLVAGLIGGLGGLEAKEASEEVEEFWEAKEVVEVNADETGRLDGRPKIRMVSSK